MCCVCMCLRSEWFIWGLPSPPGVTPWDSTHKTIIVHTNSRHYYYCTQNGASDSQMSKG